MAYYFMLEEKRGQYRELNLNNVAGFTGSKKYKKYGAYSLDEIDGFTMMFEDEIEMRKSLISAGVLSRENADKPLAIRWVDKSKKEKVSYDFLYQKDFDYVFEPYKLLQFIIDRYYCNEFGFIRSFGAHFRNHYVCANTASEVCMYADEAIRLNLSNKYLETRDRNGDSLVSRLVKLLMFKHSIDYMGVVHYTNEVQYRNLHDMIAYMNDYDQKHGIVDPKKKVTIEELFASEDINKTISETKVKKRVRRKDELEGQISFFDMFDDLS